MKKIKAYFYFICEKINLTKIEIFLEKKMRLYKSLRIVYLNLKVS